MAEAAVPAVRIGWRFIRGLGEKSRQALQAAHARAPFLSVEDVVRRAGLSRAEALSLARAGAFEAFQPGRRAAAWEALRVAGDTLPLAPARALPFDVREMEGNERIFLDYLATGICTHGHPMEHIRSRLAAAGVACSAELARLDGGEPVVVAGLVVIRQRPVSANGTVFLLLEDEHGFINIVVPKQLVEPFREAVTFAPFVVVEGRFEREGRVLNVVGRRFRELVVKSLHFQSRSFR